MWEDPIVKEVREARLEIEQECANDFDKIYQRALEIQKQVANRQVSRPLAKKEKESVPTTV